MSSEVKDQTEELLEDEVIVEEEIVEEAPKSQGPESFYDKYRKFIIGGGVALVVVVLGLVWWNNNRKATNMEAQEAMIRAVSWFEKDSINLAINGDGGQFPGFATIVEDYGGTPAGNLAKMYLGICYLKTNNLELGIEYLEDYKKSDDFMSGSAYASLGYAYEEKGDLEAAAENYLKAADIPEANEGTTPIYLMAAGRAYESLYFQNKQANGEYREKALEAYKRIRDEFPLSPDGRTIDKYIGRLSPGLSEIE